MAEFGRRGFLKLLGLGTVAAAATTFLPSLPPALTAMVEDPERLLWVPGQKKIFDMAQPVREATLQEIAAITHGHMLRIKTGQDIFLMSEAQFHQGGGLSPMIMRGGDTEVHFDNGTIAYLRGPGDLKKPLEDIRAIANLNSAHQQDRRTHIEQRHWWDNPAVTYTGQKSPAQRVSEEMARHAGIGVSPEPAFVGGFSIAGKRSWGKWGGVVPPEEKARRKAQSQAAKAFNRQYKETGDIQVDTEARRELKYQEFKENGLELDGPADPGGIVLTDQE